MKLLLQFFFLITFAGSITAQSTVFSDNFESGTSNWVMNGSWGLTTSSYHSSNHSMSESPYGNYANNLNYISSTMLAGVDLSSSLSAELSFWGKYTIEGGFDYMYLDVSPDGGTTWINLDRFDDTLSVWSQFNYSLGGYVGNSNVKIRFRFYSDGAVNYDGMYIDDVVITSDTVDNAAPLIIHSPNAFYQGSVGPNTLNAQFIDISGIDTALLSYRVDGGAFTSISATNIVSTNYTFVIPRYSAGSLVEYYFRGVDSSAAANAINTDTFSYIAGHYISYDNGQVDFVDSIGTTSGAAVRVSLPGGGNQQLASVLIRNYTDVNRPNDSMLVHVWTSVGGVPGVDIIPPKKVFPAATLQNTSAMTVVDLRSDSTLLDSLTGDIFIGYTVPSGVAWAAITEPGSGGRSFVYGASGWVSANGNSGIIDFQFRAITQLGYNPPPPPPVAAFTIDTTYSPNIFFTDASTGVVDTFYWDFGDGVYSQVQNTGHTYTSNGTYQVCLKIVNRGGSDSICHSVSISTIIPPVANFSFDISADPTVQFTDLSTNTPIQWLWDFDDNATTSNQQNPIHTFPAIGGTFHVCLTASNVYGASNPACQDVALSVGSGIDDAFAPGNITIYPNPMTDRTNINIEDMKNHKLKLRVFDMQMRRINIQYIRRGSTIELLRSGLSRGQYFIEIKVDDNTTYKAKLIVR